MLATLADHTLSGDRSQDVKVPVSFVGQDPVDTDSGTGDTGGRGGSGSAGTTGGTGGTSGSATGGTGTTGTSAAGGSLASTGVTVLSVAALAGRTAGGALGGVPPRPLGETDRGGSSSGAVAPEDRPLSVRAQTETATALYVVSGVGVVVKRALTR